MSYTNTQLRAAAWSNKITAAISFFSSSYLMYDILKDRGLCCKRRQSDATPKLLTTMQKILLGMCLLDLIAYGSSWEDGQCQMMEIRYILV